MKRPVSDFICRGAHYTDLSRSPPVTAESGEAAGRAAMLGNVLHCADRKSCSPPANVESDGSARGPFGSSDAVERRVIVNAKIVLAEWQLENS